MNLLDLIFPKQCFGCKKYGSYICKKCTLDMHIVKQKCIVCEKWAIDGFTHPRCEGKYTIDRTLSIWDYNGAIRKAIIALKYKFAKEIANELAGHIIQTLERHPEFISGSASIPLLIPIPMHWQRKNWRGFNQVEEIGKNLSSNLGLKYTNDLLLRTKKNLAQVGLKSEARQKNISGVFSINPKYSLKNTTHNLILFDDVYTTGSTLKEAGKILKKTGAKKVWALTIAR